MPEPRAGTKPIVSIDGQRLPDPFDALIVAVVVDQDLTSPAVCEVAVADTGRSFLGDVGIELGQSVEVDASPVAGDEDSLIFSGSIQAIDVTFGDGVQSVILTAYDKSFALTQQRFSKSYNDATVGDVVSSLGSELDLDVGTLEFESVVFGHLGLFDETPWDFIQRQAAASGCLVRYHEERLEVVKPTAAADAPDPGDHGARDALQLVPGHNVRQLRVHTTAARQVGEVEVRGWDPKQKLELVSSIGASTTSSEASTDPASVGGDLGAPLLVRPCPTVDEQERCDYRAASLASEFASQHYVADGEATGDPALVAGGVVSIGAIDVLCGKLLLTQCRHRFDNEGYVTEFRCTGLHDRSLLGLLDQRQRQTLSGVYPALVTDAADPDNLGRVKLRFPWLGDEYESNWARLVQPGAGVDRGFLWFPEVEDEVAVSFVDGDPSSPVVLGGFFNGVDTIPFEGFLDEGSGEVVIRGMKTRIGHVFELRDKSGEESILLESADAGVSLRLDQAGQEIEIKSSGEVLIETQTDLKIEVGGKATINAAAGLDLSSDGQVNIKGALINLN